MRFEEVLKFIFKLNLKSLHTDANQCEVEHAYFIINGSGNNVL